MNNKYKITARLLCHDVRLNTYISTIVEAETAPLKDSFERLLAPEADEALAEYRCAGCQYKLFEISVEKI